MKKNIFIATVLLLIFGGAIHAQTTAFVFQGKLQEGAAPANGTYQFQFRLFDASSGGNQIGQTLSDIPATVTNGIFAVTLDFGANSFDGAARYVEVGVRASGSGQSYTILNPRQAVTSTPYAVKSLKSEQATVADNSLNLGGIAANQYVITNDTRLSDDRNPLPDSPNYIQNTTTPQATSNFNISGEGKANVFNAATQFNIGGTRVFHLTGAFNTFAGFETGNSLTTGSYNAIFGSQSGKSNTTGMNNSFFGSLAGRDNLTGNDNSFFGQAAGLKNTTGAGNSFFGYGAGVDVTTGARNTFAGFLAGQGNTVETDNTFLGYKASGAAGITNATAIGANAFATQSNSMVLGTNLVTVQIPGNLTVANTFSANALDSGTVYKIGGTRVFHLTGANNTFTGIQSGDSITSGGFNSFYGSLAGRSNTTGNNNSFFGSFAGRENNTGSENSFFGQGAGLSNTTGAGNSLFGYGAGLNNTTGKNNTFFGFVAGQSNTVEDYNTFIGYRANGAAGITNSAAIGANAVVTTSNTIVLGTNLVTVFAPGSFNTATNYKIGGARVFHITGTDNAFVGFESGNSITTGKFNAFYGAQSGKSNADGFNNAFFGAYAGTGNIAGNNNAFFGANAGLTNRANFNSFFGSGAGLNNFNGTNNSFFGNASGLNNSSGQNNTFIGRSAGELITTGSNNTFIGALSGAALLNQTPLETGDNNVAIGYNVRFANNVSNSIGIGANAKVDSSNTIVIGDSSQTLFTNLINTGQVNADFADVAEVVTVGTLRLRPALGGGINPLCYVNVTFDGVTYRDVKVCSSSIRYKQNVQSFTRGLELLRQLRPVTFNWKSNNQADVGFIAEEVNAAEPLLSTFNDAGQIEGVKYAQITTVLVNSVKEQQAQIETLQEQIKRQQDQIEALKNLVCAGNPNAAVCAVPKDK